MAYQGQPALVDALLDQARHARVVQAPEGADLAAKAVNDARLRLAQRLQGDILRGVLALREPHRAHAALAEALKKQIRPLADVCVCRVHGV